MAEAFSDYAIPMALSQERFEFLMHQRSLELQSSRVAVSDGKVVAIWLTGTRGESAYLISSGTRPEFRSRGMARAMADSCLKDLRERGFRSFQTEVLRTNHTAARLYQSLGMVKQRLLDCYQLPPTQAHTPIASDFKQINWDRISSQASNLRDWDPSWQNNDQSLDAIAKKLLCLSVCDGADLAAYIAIDASSGTVHQLAVRDDVRRVGIASSLLQATQTLVLDPTLKLINICQADTGFRALMKRLGANETIGQFELKMSL